MASAAILISDSLVEAGGKEVFAYGGKIHVGYIEPDGTGGYNARPVRHAAASFGTMEGAIKYFKDLFPAEDSQKQVLPEVGATQTSLF
jgi:hypothetical protein